MTFILAAIEPKSMETKHYMRVLIKTHHCFVHIQEALAL